MNCPVCNKKLYASIIINDKVVVYNCVRCPANQFTFTNSELTHYSFGLYNPKIFETRCFYIESYDTFEHKPEGTDIYVGLVDGTKKHIVHSEKFIPLDLSLSLEKQYEQLDYLWDKIKIWITFL